MCVDGVDNSFHMYPKPMIWILIDLVDVFLQSFTYYSVSYFTLLPSVLLGLK